MTENSLVARMAEQRHIDPAAFYRAIKGTLMPSGTTDEQIAAFLLVADRYKLDPITREIFAFPARKGGGIMPVLSIDGWVKLVNSHPQANGFEIEFHSDAGKLVSATCRMFRKDRDKPVVITEFLAECYRNTDAWNQMPRRMLRHKAFKECARYAFGFSGLVDEDEARDAVREIGSLNGGEAIEATIAQEMADQLDQWAAEDENQDAASDNANEAVDDAGSSVEAASEAGDDSIPSSSPAVPKVEQREAVDQLLKFATDPNGGDEQAKLEWLTNLQPSYADRLDPEFTRQLFQTVTKVVKGEIKEAAARKYLAAL